MPTPYDHVNQETAEKQFSSHMCFVCGISNPAGLHAHFYQTDKTTCVGRFLPAEEHQGYPGRVHGGIVASMLDETLGRAVWGDAQTWGVTAELTISYKAPVPLGEMLTAVGRIVHENRSIFKAEGALLTANGTVAVRAKGTYVKLSIDRILKEVEGELDLEEALFIVPDEAMRTPTSPQ